MAKRRLCLGPSSVINCTPLSALSFWVSLFPRMHGYHNLSFLPSLVVVVVLLLLLYLFGLLGIFLITFFISFRYFYFAFFSAVVLFCCCCSILVVPLFILYLFIYFYLTLLFCFFFLLPCLFVLFCLLYSSVGTLIWPCFLLCVLVRFVFNSLISFWGSFAHQSTLLYLILLGLFWSPLCVCVFVYVPLFLFLLIWFCFYHLSVSFFACFFFLCLIPFTAMTHGLWDLGSPSQAQVSGMGVLSPGH